MESDTFYGDCMVKLLSMHASLGHIRAVGNIFVTPNKPWDIINIILPIIKFVSIIHISSPRLAFVGSNMKISGILIHYISSMPKPSCIMSVQYTGVVQYTRGCSVHWGIS